MKILLHICCANCAINPLQRLKEEGHEVTGYFFNPNIHPYQEYQRRLETVRQYSEKTGLAVIYRDEYLLEEFLRNTSHRVQERCLYCYQVRLEATAREAKGRGFHQFTTTLLESTHQNHALIRKRGEGCKRNGNTFLLRRLSQRSGELEFRFLRPWGCTANSIAVAYTAKKNGLQKSKRRVKGRIDHE